MVIHQYKNIKKKEKKRYGYIKKTKEKGK